MAARSELVFKWQFAPRFRRNAFGWKSDAPIQRIKEAIAEIRQVARKDKRLAAEGAVIFLEKLSPAIEQVDSSSGALGSAVYRAIDVLVPIISQAEIEPKTRQIWLERLWQAIQDDGIGYIESLANHWGELCSEPKIAEHWIDEFRPMVEYTWSPHANGHGHFHGIAACLSAMMAARQYEPLLGLLEMSPRKYWHERHWGVRALVALGRKAEAIRYTEASRGLNMPDGIISRVCEEILLSSGLAEEAYSRYAIAASQGTTHLATFRAIVKKYPNKPQTEILRDLIASTPGAEGKWFAAAKDAGLFETAIELVNRSPTDPRTLIRAARDHAEKHPDFALAAGLAALRWMACGYGYEITEMDILDAHNTVMKASTMAGFPVTETQARVNEIICGTHPMQQFMTKFLKSYLAIQVPVSAHLR